ncbi:MAG: hypothetical protein WC735_02640 [Candidatus Paceibacterota bacterium]
MPSESFNLQGDQESSMSLKKQVLQQLVERLETNLKMLITSRDDKREMARDAPSANQSHSDTSKSQLSIIQLGLDSKKIEVEKAISLLKQMPINIYSKITPGAIFAISEIGGNSEEDNYFLVPVGGGEELDINNLNIVSITPQAPIARACLQKNKGDIFVFQGRKLKITNIF